MPGTLHGATLSGRAHLEPRELIFRGDVRVKIPLAPAVRVSTRGGRLRIESDAETIELDLGAERARAWADRIRHPKSRIEKLGVAPVLSCS